MTEYVYDMSDSERDALTARFLDTKRLGCNRFACFAMEGTDPFANIARQVEREVFEASWGNDAAMMKREYGPYDESSLFFLVVDTRAGVPAGALRMIRNSPAGLKTIVDLDDCVKSPIAPRTISVAEVMRHHGIDDLDDCWDGATAAIPRHYRRRLVATHVQLMRIMALAARRENIKHFVAVLDAPVVKMARDVLRLPLTPLAGTPPFTHMDAPENQAVYAHVPSILGLGGRRNRKVGQKISDCLGETSTAVPAGLAAR